MYVDNFLLYLFLIIRIKYTFVSLLTSKTKQMKALVKVNGVSVGMFYNLTSDETRAQMHQRIMNIIIYRYGASNLDIKWEY